jgi:hypothetical protein
MDRASASVPNPASVWSARDVSRRRAAVLAAFPILVWCPLQAAAQTVRGTLVESGTQRPIHGAFVVLEDSTGASVSTTVTSGAGTWLLRAPGTGTYRVRSDRIGYASTFSELFRLEAGDEASRRIEVPVAPIVLSELVVTGEGGRCATVVEESRTIRRVWEEARKALSAIVWTGQQPYYRFDAVHFYRSLDPDGRPATEIRYEEVRYYGRHPFRSISPRDLALGGFVQSTSGSVDYHGPDADVLLSSEFLRRHCFRLRETIEAGRVALEFEPLDNVRVTDISGTMLLDAGTAELQSLDFRYENLDLDIDTSRLGGRVEFARLPSGAWIVRNWAIRIPIIEWSSERTTGGRRRPARPVLSGLREAGGHVTAVFRTSRDRHAAGAASAGLSDRPLPAPGVG